MAKPERKVPSSASIDGDGRPICVLCQKRLRWYINGYGYAGREQAIRLILLSSKGKNDETKTGMA